VSEILGRDRFMAVWWGTPVECESALARGERLGALSPPSADSARHHLRVLAGGWTEVEPSDLVRRRAVAFLRAHPLRAADSLQLAAAAVWAEGQRGDRFMTLDNRLAGAAMAEGFELLLPHEELT
jgi:uncharacterized protein